MTRGRNDMKPTAAQVAQRAASLDAVLGYSMSFAALCDIVLACIEARDDVAPDDLMTLGNRLCRLADERERERK